MGEIQANVFFMDWEVSAIEWLQRSLGSAGELIAKVLSFMGGEIFMVIVLVLLTFCYKKEAGKRCGFTILTASMWFPMIKNIVLRVRPYMAHDSIECLQKAEADADAMDIRQQGYSFPSGHSALSVTMYGGIAREIRKRWVTVLAIVLSLLIGISRLAVGAHYPTDVLAGWVVGLLAIGFNILLEKIRKEWVRHLILLALTVPGIFWCSSRDYFTSLGLMIGLIAAIPVDRIFANYQDTRNPWAMVLRVAGALAIYFTLNTVLKLPFSKEFLDNGTLGANLIRTGRYAVILFILLAVYPKVFPLFEKVGAKKAKE